MRLVLFLLLASAVSLHAQRVDPNALRWRPLQAGLSWTDFQVRAGSWKLPIRVVVARIQPDAFDLRLALATTSNRMTGVWNVDSVPRAAAIAFNAGQFKETGPWGWLVMHARELRHPGYGPLSAGIAIDSSGAVRWLDHTELVKARTDSRIAFAFQSYPVLLHNGRAPLLLFSSNDVDRKHRDARLILGQMADGSLVIALTRYDALGGVTQRLPIGLTVPEAVVMMQSLGARNAVMLDGGISAQLMLRDSSGTAQVWKGLRNVPLGFIATPRKN